MIEILILSIIQGATEFLPVSSSSHLIIFSNFLNFQNQSLSIDVSLHIGSFLAVIIFFYKDVLNFINEKDIFFKIILSSVPVVLVGFFLVETNLISKFRNIEVIGWMTLIFGIILYLSDRFRLDNELKKDFDFKSAITIGLFQVLSLVPGVSRSGIAISAARILKFKRYDSAKISFLLSIPILGAISIFGIKNLVETNSLEFTITNIFSVLISFFVSFITIKFFLNYVQKFDLKIFVIYRIVLGIILISLSYL
tara:strand:+ start:838 stop:1596 length:759 start_codon:yes stop_codon:yes gene_type:complete